MPKSKYFQLSIYFTYLLLGVGYLTWVNVGSMVCSAPSDPFDKTYYRMYGIVHQFIGIFLFGNIVALVNTKGKQSKIL